MRTESFVEHCEKYKGAIHAHSIAQLSLNLFSYISLAAVSLYAVHAAPWVMLFSVPLAGGFLVRIFIVQHDCGHGSFFATKEANDAVGRFLSVLTVTPYSYWRHAHALHHATSGNLDRRGVGDVKTLTVAEYRALSLVQRFCYRAYRNPLVILAFGAPFHFLIHQRVPFGLPKEVPGGWRSIASLNVTLAIVYGSLFYFVGWQTLAIGLLPIICIGAWVGGWLFFVQHQFEDTFWAKNENWNRQLGAIAGSSYYVLPKFLQWFTGNIGLHHVHHLCSKIPNYRLQACLDACPELQQVNRLTFWKSLNSARLALWDEELGKLVGIRAAWS
jgi:omega-6 fatty acid desaturase (delta-12 desaturase)